MQTISWVAGDGGGTCSVVWQWDVYRWCSFLC